MMKRKKPKSKRRPGAEEVIALAQQLFEEAKKVGKLKPSAHGVVVSGGIRRIFPRASSYRDYLREARLMLAGHLDELPPDSPM